MAVLRLLDHPGDLGKPDFRIVRRLELKPQCVNAAMPRPPESRG